MMFAFMATDARRATAASQSWEGFEKERKK
jgi:hypothetical protein